MHPDEIVLNEYVDASLETGQREEVARHLQDCSACRAIVDDLTALKSAAQALGDISPPSHVWPRVLEAAASASRRRSTEPPWWAFAAAAAALVAAVWLGSRTSSTPAGTRAVNPGQVASAGASRDTVEAELREAEQHYVNAITVLQQIAAADSSRLDPETMATLQKNLALIDQAITESRAAINAQPASDTARASLFDGLRAKLALLNDAVTLISDPRNKG